MSKQRDMSRDVGGQCGTGSQGKQKSTNLKDLGKQPGPKRSLTSDTTWDYQKAFSAASCCLQQYVVIQPEWIKIRTCWHMPRRSPKETPGDQREIEVHSPCWMALSLEMGWNQLQNIRFWRELYMSSWTNGKTHWSMEGPRTRSQNSLTYAFVSDTFK